MNHPTNEEWMSYCYDEVTAKERAALSAHLRACPECARNFQSWNDTRRELSSWQLPKQRSRRRLMPVALTWAAAAAVVIVLSFTAGRLGFEAQNARKIRSTLEPEIRLQLQDEFSRLFRAQLEKSKTSLISLYEERLRESLKSLESQHARERQDIQALYVALDKIDSRRAADYVALKKELDALAINADAQLRSTERRLIEVAALAQNPSAHPPQD